MSRAGRVLQEAHRDTARVSGEMSIALAQQLPLRSRTLHDWVLLLRRSADRLEELERANRS